MTTHPTGGGAVQEDGSTPFGRAGRTRWRGLAPAATLFVLSPVIAEVLFGSTHLSNVRALGPALLLFGGVALGIRETARRRRYPVLAVLVLGVAFAVLLECVVLQTGLAPPVGLDPHHVYGRAGGVNWIYLLWASGYWSVWGIVIPIQLTELAFPDRRDDPWLPLPATIAMLPTALAGAVGAWYLWTAVVVPSVFRHPAYQPPPATLLLATLAVACVAGTGVLLGRALPARAPTPVRREPRRLVTTATGTAAFALSAAWFVLVVLGYGAVPRLPPPAAAVGGVVVATTAALLVTRTTRTGSDRTCRALVTGALLASMLVGFFASGITRPPDLVAKLVVDALAVLGLALLPRRWNRDRDRGSAARNH